VRLLLDECISARLAPLLVDAGRDVCHLLEDSIRICKLPVGP
jgi:hypothetical protein